MLEFRVFVFNSKPPIRGTYWQRLVDILSGLLFLFPAYIAYVSGLVFVALMAFLVAITSVFNIIWPNHFVRIIDYSFAVSYILVCLAMVIYSGFVYPMTVYAAICAAIAFVFYGLHACFYRNNKWSILYVCWHVFAVGVAIFSTLAYLG